MKKLLLTVGIAALVVLLVIGAGCTSTTEQTAQSGDTANVYYTMYVDGEEYQTNVGGTPFTFVIDGGKVISGFNAAVKGMKVGETKNVTIPPSEGYGEKTMDVQQTVSLSQFESDSGQTLEVGDELNLYSPTAGNIIGTVVSVNRDTDELVLALNTALAGKTLVYEITLDSIESA